MDLRNCKFLFWSCSCSDLCIWQCFPEVNRRPWEITVPSHPHAWWENCPPLETGSNLLMKLSSFHQAPWPSRLANARRSQPLRQTTRSSEEPHLPAHQDRRYPKNTNSFRKCRLPARIWCICCLLFFRKKKKKTEKRCDKFLRAQNDQNVL